ncbi:Down syndrome cell adhesion molecule-like protein Dscam2 [Tetranychus urticae]|uniref:Uncharacterized protein n=1 Tax=Tetranychus urticae TaxID=32264 RepID=T1KBM8_TETUR|nr:Down syndrome cell adhesion molecule-like protein Dscam2 [Tetranychus urticae]
MFITIFVSLCICMTTSAADSTTPEWDEVPYDLNLGLGDSIKINCSAHGTPEPIIRWSKITHQDTGESSTVILTGSSHLILDPVKLSDDGQYECKATNPKNQQSISKTFKIKVFDIPRFISKTSRVTALRGATAVLTCEVFGGKPITNSWFRELAGKLESIECSTGQPHSSASRYSVVEKDSSYESESNRSVFELHISEVELNDSGSYICKASNEFGKDQKTNILTVQDLPSSPANIVIDEIFTRTVSLHWTAASDNGSPIKRYLVQYWQGATTSNTNKLFEEDASLKLSYQLYEELDPGVTYSIRVVAENSLGKGLPSKTIAFTTKEEKPDGAPIDIQVESKGTQTIEVVWKAPFTNHWRGRLKGYNLAYRELKPDEDTTSSSTSYPTTNVDIKFDGDAAQSYQQKTTIKNLKAKTSYLIMIRAYNDAGFGPFSAPITVETAHLDPPKPPKIRIADKKASSLLVKLDESEVNNDVDYYIIYFKEENSSWLHRSFPKSKSNDYELDNLKSGTWYEIYMVSESDAGSSEPSKNIMIKTLEDSYQPVTEPSYDDLRSAQYYGSFIVIPIAITIIIVVIVCAVAYVFVYIEGKKTDILASNYMTHTPAQNFQYIGPLSPQSGSLHHPTIMSTDNSVLSLHRYANDTIGRSQPLLTRTLLPKGSETMKCYYHKRPIMGDTVNQEYATPYETRIYRERSSSLPPVPPVQDNQRMIGTMDRSRNLPSQHIYMNGSHSSLASITDFTRKPENVDDSNTRYDYFNFL